jgi:alpha-tubulin suppressor-like RCC1 family protein
MITSDYSVVDCGFLGQNSFFLSEHRDLFVCGNNEYGQLGLGNTTHQNLPQRFPVPRNQSIISLSSGTRHSAFVTVEGKLYSFGHNDKKQLGAVHAPEKVASPLYVQSQYRFIAVSCGNQHTLALTDNFEVISFGSNDFGQLGVPRPNVGLNKVNLPEKIISIICGHDHSAALSGTGKLYTWGCGTSGQLGLGHSENVNRPEVFVGIPDRIVKVVCGYMHTAVFSEKGELFVFGFMHNDLKFGEDGKLVKSFPANDPVVSIASGSAHILVLTASGFVQGFGANGHGQLGIDGKVITKFQDISSLRGRKISQIATGFQHSFALTNTGQVLAFGRNERGQLGLGHSKGVQDIPAPVNIPGVNRIIDIYNLSQHAPLLSASMVAEEVEEITLSSPDQTYHPDYHLQFQALESHEETSLPLPQTFSIIGKKK